MDSILAHYHWQLVPLLILALVALHMAAFWTGKLVPAMRVSHELNETTYKQRMENAAYAANQAWNRKWSLLYMVVIFGAILPFCLTLDPGPWWEIPLHMVVILMVYDLFYYVTHRFIFHDNGWLGGPLKWMHAVHHRQHNPCRKDSSYIHPLEVSIGLGLYVGTIFLLSRFMGEFHVATVAVTFFAFSAINVHNHALWEANDGPFNKVLHYVARMHHNHHARFIGGNYATITLLYDWMFGTLDHGQGWKKKKPEPAPAV
jgi:sterol desaturase/sphingolipid hydroxylase (fatty acid hydroxylase superfamily)